MNKKELVGQNKDLWFFLIFFIILLSILNNSNYTCSLNDLTDESYWTINPELLINNCDYCQYSWNGSVCSYDVTWSNEKKLYQRYLCSLEEIKLRNCIEECNKF